MKLTRGMIAQNPATGSIWSVEQTGAEAPDHKFCVRVVCQPKAAADTRLHIHSTLDEEFHILEGKAQYRLGKDLMHAGPGDILHLPAGTPHQHPWACGETNMVYLHKARFAHHQEHSFEDVWGATFSVFGSSLPPSQIRPNGMPYSVLQAAAVARAFGKNKAYDCALPVPLSIVANATLGRVAELLGYRGVAPTQIQKALLQ